MRSGIFSSVSNGVSDSASYDSDDHYLSGKNLEKNTVTASNQQQRDVQKIEQADKQTAQLVKQNQRIFEWLEKVDNSEVEVGVGLLPGVKEKSGIDQSEGKSVLLEEESASSKTFSL